MRNGASLAVHLFVVLLGCEKCPQSNFVIGEKELFVRCRHQLILDALLLYPFGIEEGPKRHFLSDVPFGRFCFPGQRVRQ